MSKPGPKAQPSTETPPQVPWLIYTPNPAVGRCGNLFTTLRVNHLALLAVASGMAIAAGLMILFFAIQLARRMTFGQGRRFA